MASRFMAAARAKALRKDESRDETNSFRGDAVPGSDDEEAALMFLMQRYMKISNEKRHVKGHPTGDEALVSKTGPEREPAEQNAAAIERDALDYLEARNYYDPEGEMDASKEKGKNGEIAAYGEPQKRGNLRNRGRRGKLEMEDSKGHVASSRVPPPAKRSRKVGFSPDNAKHKRHAKKEAPKKNKPMQEQLKSARKGGKGGRFSPQGSWSLFSRSSYSLPSRSSGTASSPRAGTQAESGRREKDMRKLHTKLAREREARMDLELRLAKERAIPKAVSVDAREKAPQKREEHNEERAARKRDESRERAEQKRGKEGKKKQHHHYAENEAEPEGTQRGAVAGAKHKANEVRWEEGIESAYDMVKTRSQKDQRWEGGIDSGYDMEKKRSHKGQRWEGGIESGYDMNKKRSHKEQHWEEGIESGYDMAKKRSHKEQRWEGGIESGYDMTKQRSHKEQRWEQQSAKAQRGTREDEKAKRTRDDERAKKERYAQLYAEATQRGTREDERAQRKTADGDERATEEPYAALYEEMAALRSELGGLRKDVATPDNKGEDAGGGCSGIFGCGPMACCGDRDDAMMEDVDLCRPAEDADLSWLANSFREEAEEEEEGTLLAGEEDDEEGTLASWYTRKGAEEEETLATPFFREDVTEESREGSEPNSLADWAGSPGGSGEGAEVDFMDDGANWTDRRYGRHGGPRMVRGRSHVSKC